MQQRGKFKSKILPALWVCLIRVRCSALYAKSKKQLERKREKEILEKEALRIKKKVLIWIILLLIVVATIAGIMIYKNVEERQKAQKERELTDKFLPDYLVFSGGERVSKEGIVIVQDKDTAVSFWSTPYEHENRKEFTIRVGEKVDIIREIDDQYRLSTGEGKAGWISKQNIKITQTFKATKAEPYQTFKTVTITTITEGYDVEKVNLYNCPSCDGRRVVATCINGEEVKLISKTDEYVKVKKSNGKEGWCMEGWVKK